MSVIQFGCPFCGAVAEVDANLAGLETVCPACECVLVIPQTEPMPPQEIDAPTSEPFEKPDLAMPPASQKPEPSKRKLWQSPQRQGAAAGKTSPSDPGPLASDPFAAVGPAADTGSSLDNPLGDLAADAPLSTSRYGRSAHDIARQKRQERRFWSNAAMLVCSVVILCVALAVLMALTAK